MKIPLFVLIAFLFMNPLFSQENTWFYFRAKDTLFNPVFEKAGNTLVYTGTDEKLKSVLKTHTIYEFKKTYKGAKKENLKKTFFVIAKDEILLVDLLQKASHIFEFGEIVPKEDRKIFEPNDYGLTSTIGKNIGLQVNLDYLDFLGVPHAWYYTTGSKDMVIGISDGTVDIANLEFSGKTQIFRPSSFSNGHGTGVASIAAARGNNAFGVPGVCFDCSIATTTYGSFKDFNQLMELSVAGVKAINCSWASSGYFESAQDSINKMFKKGTLIIAAAGNNDWKKSNQGQKLYYPASYDHVISVSSGMYKYETVQDNIDFLENGMPFAENIRGYVGRTMGFKDNDITTEPHIYPVSVTTLNSEVDILAPSTGVFLYGRYLRGEKHFYDIYEHTSNATPLVTGTVGLMLSLYPCLPIDEVESILKITATNIDHIKANKPFAGKYGAGMLNTGKAVEMVYTMFSENETVVIENQNFTRWDFKLTSLSEKVVITNQTFAENATLKLTAKNQIVIGKNTVLKPNAEGSLHFKIDPKLKKECELQLREGFPGK